MYNEKLLDEINKLKSEEKIQFGLFKAIHKTHNYKSEMVCFDTEQLESEHRLNETIIFWYEN